MAPAQRAKGADMTAQLEKDLAEQPEAKPIGAPEQPQVAPTPPEERGDKPMLAEMPTFELAGRTYTMRRLNYADHSRLAGIVRVAVAMGEINLAAVAASGDPAKQMNALIMLLLNALAYAETAVQGFLASVVGVDRPTLLDPDYFPFASLPRVVRKLKEHPDLQDFFVQVGEELKEQATPTPPSSGLPTSSPDDTDTPMPTS